MCFPPHLFKVLFSLLWIHFWRITLKSRVIYQHTAYKKKSADPCRETWPCHFESQIQMLCQFRGQGQHLGNEPSAHACVGGVKQRNSTQTCGHHSRSYTQNFLLACRFGVVFCFFLAASSLSCQTKHWLSWVVVGSAQTNKIMLLKCERSVKKHMSII